MISITLPSVYPDALAAALANIAETTRGAYEVIVASPILVKDPHVIWIPETEARGCASAHSIAAEAATGEFIVAFADDHRFEPGWDTAAIANFKRREGAWRASASPADGAAFALGLRGAHSGHVGTNWGIYYPYFPMMRTADVWNTGWIGADYRHGFGDSDLAMRIWSAGGRCEWSDVGLLAPSPDDKRKAVADPARRPAAAYTDADLALFVSRWAPTFGQRFINDMIDGFNVDLRPEDNADLCQGSTIHHNDPGFMANVQRMA